MASYRGDVVQIKVEELNGAGTTLDPVDPMGELRVKFFALSTMIGDFIGEKVSGGGVWIGGPRSWGRGGGASGEVSGIVSCVFFVFDLRRDKVPSGPDRYGGPYFVVVALTAERRPIVIIK